MRDDQDEDLIENIDPRLSQKAVLDYLFERFGLGQEQFDHHGLYLSTKGRLFLGPKRLIDKPRIVTLGLLIARLSGTIKPTTNLLQAFGKHVSKNVVSLSKEQTIEYAKGRDITIDESQSISASDGYILLRYGSCQLGCGLLKGKAIKNMLPKAKRLELRYI